MQRLAVVYGEPKGRTQESAALMAKEWFNALRPFGSKTLARSVTKALRTLKWWPSLAEIVALCREERESWEDAVGVGPAGGQKPFTEPKRADLTADDIARRAAEVLKWKQQYGWNKSDEIRIGEESEVRASQDMTVSSALLRTCVVRRSRGLPTCSPTCRKTNCNLKDCEE